MKDINLFFSLNLPFFQSNEYFWYDEAQSGGYEEFSIFWDVTPCSPLTVNRRFERASSLHL
jgi:hypothetical protein